EIDAAETKPRQEDIDAITERLLIQRLDRSRQRLRTIRFGPALIHFRVRFFDGHLQWRVSHGKWDELLPVLGTSQPSGLLQPLVERSCGQRSQQAKNRQTRRPG